MNERTIGWDFVGDYCVSTCRLVIDHGFDGTPLWYETMVFPAKNGEVTDWGDVWCERYTTRDEAMAGHSIIVQKVERGELIDGSKRPPPLSPEERKKRADRRDRGLLNDGRSCDVCGHPVAWDKDYGWLHKDFGPEGRSFDHSARIDGDPRA